MSDYSELRRLAHEASETEMDWLDRGWLAAIMADDWADYVAAIEPQVVIDLIDENERLDRESQNLSSQLGACDRERRQLKAESEALRRVANELRRFAGCNDVHHDRADQHEYDEPCKVLARIDSVLGQRNKSDV
ncbi:MAG: hypothetical protein K5804_17730 [Microbacterium sp.]|uniref:hypothetical protein n=1 Tax=Microbacterium sp. TaxID=51671 RepID=UPI0026353E1D|nr:hypothetical protein [Microbacterium sp.]MCV0420085.1 hypothetical protein [Microbacterium sp.]